MEENNEEVVAEPTTDEPKEPTLLQPDPEGTEDKIGKSTDDLDPRFLNEEGLFNEEGAREYMSEVKNRDDKYNKRIQDMRKMVSTKDDFVENKEEYFQDFAPEEKYMKYFGEDTPEDIQKEIKGLTDRLADQYNELALNKKQALGVSNTILDILEQYGVLDTKSEDEQRLAKQKWVEGQKAKLGANADNIIREAQVYIGNENAFDTDVKKYMLEMIDVVGAPFIDVVNQMKDKFGGATGGVPSSVIDLSGLAPDADLKQEYLNKETTDFRRQQITAKRAQAGRTTRLMDAEF